MNFKIFILGFFMTPSLGSVRFYFKTNRCKHTEQFILSADNIHRKGNEDYLYSAFIQHLVSKRSDMDHTVLPAKYTMPAFPPDGASSKCGGKHLIAAHYSFIDLERMKG